MKLGYSEYARMDLQEISRYIRIVLKNPAAAKQTVKRIRDVCHSLKDMPYMGAVVSVKTGIETDLRYIVAGKYIAVYKVRNGYVEILRIFDGRTDYIRRLLRDLETT